MSFQSSPDSGLELVYITYFVSYIRGSKHIGTKVISEQGDLLVRSELGWIPVPVSNNTIVWDYTRGKILKYRRGRWREKRLCNNQFFDLKSERIFVKNGCRWMARELTLHRNLDLKAVNVTATQTTMIVFLPKCYRINPDSTVPLLPNGYELDLSKVTYLTPGIFSYVYVTSCGVWTEVRYIIQRIGQVVPVIQTAGYTAIYSNNTWNQLYRNLVEGDTTLLKIQIPGQYIISISLEYKHGPFCNPSCVREPTVELLKNGVIISEFSPNRIVVNGVVVSLAMPLNICSISFNLVLPLAIGDTISYNDCQMIGLGYELSQGSFSIHLI